MPLRKSRFSRKPRRRTKVRPRVASARRRKPRVNNGKVVLYKSPANSILPREYFCKFRSRYQASLLVAGWAAGQSYQLTFRANDPFSPFASLPAAGANITYMNSTTPVGRTATDFSTLCNLQHYIKCLCTSAKLKIRCSQSIITTNDSLLCTITPSVTSPGTIPTNASSAMSQPYTKFKEFSGANLTGSSVSNYIDFANFIGMPKMIYHADQAGLASVFYNSNAGMNVVYFVVNLNTLDCVVPSDPVPVEFELTQYCKLYDWGAAEVVQ